MHAIISVLFLTELFKIPAITALQCAVCTDNSLCLEMLVAECPLGKNYQCVDAYNKPTLVYPKGQLQKSCMPKYYHCNVPNGICTNCLGDLCNLGTGLDYYYKKYIENLTTPHNDKPGSGSGQIIRVVVDDGTAGKGLGSNTNNKHVNSFDYNYGNIAKVIRIKDGTTNNQQVDGTDNGRIIFIKDGTADTKNNVNPDTSSSVTVGKGLGSNKHVNNVIRIKDVTTNNQQVDGTDDGRIIFIKDGTADTKNNVNPDTSSTVTANKIIFLHDGTNTETNDNGRGAKGPINAGFGLGNLGGISVGSAGGGDLASMLEKLVGLKINIGSGGAGGTEGGMNGQVDTTNKAGGEFGEGKLIAM